jgi:hypothetical protein
MLVLSLSQAIIITTNHSTIMTLHPNEFPITIQAFDISNDKEFFVAEQMVNNQQEVETFSNRYAGKVIKAKAISSTEKSTTVTKARKSSGAGLKVFLVILIILIILAAIGFYDGWIQRHTGIAL